MAGLLNVLLERGVTVQPGRSRHFWAIVPGAETFESRNKWVQEGYCGSLGEAVQEEPSAASPTALKMVDPGGYYGSAGTGPGDEMRLPTDLDEAICRYFALSRSDRHKFDRAAFWMDAASRQHDFSVSASFAFLAMSIEALVGRVENPTAKFCEFIDRHVPGIDAKARSWLCDFRSEIVHGSALMEIDQDAHFAWTPPERTETDLARDLWRLTRIALRGWLMGRP